MPLAVDLVLALLSAVAATVIATTYPWRYRQRALALRAARATGEMAAEHRSLRRILDGRLDPEVVTGLLLTVALACVMVGATVVGMLAYLTRGIGPLQGVDDWAADWGAAHASAFSTSGLKAITFLGETTTVIVVAVIVCALDVVRTRSLVSIAFCTVVIAGQGLLNVAVKDLAGRVRPALDPIAATLGPSFPSGHTAAAAASYAAIALVLSRHVPRPWRPPLAGTAVGLAVAVAGTRVLLDVHWLTDVVGGLSLGWGWFALCSVAFAGRLLDPRLAERTAARAATAPTVPERRESRRVSTR